MTEDDGLFYIKSVTELGDTHEIVVAEDIYTASGAKLINNGTRINSSFHEQLVQHKLSMPLDHSLAIRNAVSPEDLMQEVKRIFEECPQIVLMARALPDRTYLRYALSEIHLNAALAFKLTVAREMRPELYKHAVLVALIGLYLGARSGLSAREQQSLGAAGVFHDLGELHIAPALLDRSQPLTKEGQHCIYVHPVTTYLLLARYEKYHPAVSTAVLEHHERLDGSGYPRGIKGDKLSKLGKILAVAEVAGSQIERSQDGDCTSLEITMKLNPKQFQPDLAGYLSGLCKRGEATQQPVSQENLAQLRQQFAGLAALFDSWDKLKEAGGVRSDEEETTLMLVSERVFNLEKALFDAGFDPSKLNDLTKGLEDDPIGMAELESLLKETRWQLMDTVREIERRWPVLTAGEGEKQRTPLAKWVRRAGEL